MKYLQVFEILKITSRRWGYPSCRETEYYYIGENEVDDIKSFFEVVNKEEYYNILIKKNIFGITEAISNERIFILENNKKSLNNLRLLLNECHKILVVYKRDLNEAKVATADDVSRYLEYFKNSEFGKDVNYKTTSLKDEKIKIKRMIKEYKKY